MRLNRRVPNGTHGGVRGRGLLSPSYSIIPPGGSVAEERAASAKAAVTLKVLACGSGGGGGVIAVRAFTVSETASAVRLLLPLGAGTGKLNVAEIDDRLTSDLAGLPVGPDVLVEAADEVYKRALLELHFLDPLAEIAEGLDVQVDPAGVVLGVLVIDALTDAEADDVAVVGEFEGGLVVKAAGDDGVGCDKL